MIGRPALALIAAVPLIGATAAAGIIASPAKTRPCVTEFSEGFSGGPSHADLGPDGKLWVTEGRDDKIARFDVKQKRAVEFDVPKGTELHDLAVGPDRNLWFSGLNGQLGRFDIKTNEVTTFPGGRRASQPHLWWAPDGQLYYGNLKNGRLGRFDPDTEQRVESRLNLPPDSGIHGFAQVSDGSAWWTLEHSDQLAHLDLQSRRFDKFVAMPKGSGPHWVVYRRGDNALYVMLEFANKVARYDLDGGRVQVFDLGLEPITAEEVEQRKPGNALNFGAVDADGEALWLTTLAGGQAIRFDLDSHEVTKVGCGITFPAATITLANDRAGDLWVTVSPPTPGPGAMGRIER